MKKLFLLITIVALLFSACDKEDIPKPETPHSTSEPKPLFVSGTLDGTEFYYAVDGVDISAKSEFIPQKMNQAPYWGFGIWTNPNSFYPTFNFVFVNHSLQMGGDTDDLHTTLDKRQLDFIHFQDPEPDYVGKVAIDYFDATPETRTTVFSENQSLNIISKRDTVVNEQEYVVVELEGMISVSQSVISPPLVIENMRARIALKKP